MTANTWSTAGVIRAYPLAGIAGAFAATITNGSVIAGSGWCATSTITANTYRYDPGANTWTYCGTATGGHLYPGYGVLSNDSVLVFAGMNTSGSLTNISHRYDPGANTWTQVANFPNSWLWMGSAALSNGSILSVGGGTTSVGNTLATRYDPEANAWTTVASYPYTVSALSCSRIGNGCILAITGATNPVPTVSNICSNCYLYDPTANSWSRTASYPIPVYLVASAPLSNGSVLAWGGSANEATSSTANAYRYDPGANAWTQVANYPVAGKCTASEAVLLSNGWIMGMGGIDSDHNDVPQPNCYVYDPGYVLGTTTSVYFAVP